MHRVLLDTNVLIAAAYNPDSPSFRIVDMVAGDELKLIISTPIRREYEKLLPNAVRAAEKRNWIWQIVDSGELVTPEENPPVTEDRADDKFLAAAVTARAEAIISSDKHLLAVHPYRGIEILKPSRFLNQLLGVDP